MIVRVVLVDDNAGFLDAARGLLEREGLAVVGVASTGAEALALVDGHDPDVVLVDVDLGDESGFDVAEGLCRTGRRWPVILISADSEADLEDLIDSSAAIGFVSKSRLSAITIVELLDRDDRTGSDPLPRGMSRSGNGEETRRLYGGS
jgi:DNA-binding NarL/FixJ family response regulator